MTIRHVTNTQQDASINDDSKCIGTRSNDRRILFLSLEFNFSPFSGNGVLARSLVSSLVRIGSTQVRVVCSRPHPSTPDISSDICMTSDEVGSSSGLDIWPVELPQHCQWKRLDRMGPWKEFSTSAGLDFRSRIKEFRPTDVVCVDWHGILAWESIRCAFLDEGNRLHDAVVCYYNFRVYSSSCWDHTTTSMSQQKVENADDVFYREQELLSCRLADKILCLAEHDRKMLQCLMKDHDFLHHFTDKEKMILLPKQSAAAIEKKINNISILPPPLRGDIWELASNSMQNTDEYDRYLPPEASDAIKTVLNQHCVPSLRQSQRFFLTCMVRLSPEKSAHHYVTLLQKLGGVQFLRRRGLIPLLCGAKSVGSYAQQVVDDFKSACSSDSSDGITWPCVVIDRFLGPKELAAVFSRTAINVHPSLYDAYGMTLVESAAFGVPSIVNTGGKVGAVSLLGEGKGCIDINLEKILGVGDTPTNVCDGPSNDIKALVQVLSSLENNHDCAMNLEKVATEARTSALGWNEMACCQSLVNELSNMHRERYVELRVTHDTMMQKTKF